MTDSNQQKAFEVADRTLWATSILMACGYALKEMLTTQADGKPGIIYKRTLEDDGGFPIFDNQGNPILDEWADEMAQTMIQRAVEIFGILDEHGFQDEDDLAVLLKEHKEHDQQPQSQTDTS